ncbi:ParA family protein [Serratia fonticola]|uniref:ParA family protein n=1 Tax=Serratia fonticola TaxID=47917 RepID=UPI0013771DDB|nr:ParA family protein [Serratia fonticola]NCG54467.1 AAA family ATPase [Serratia fonticola]
MHDINHALTKSAPHVVSFINTKGGGGKSTLTANTVGFLADAGLRVLGIDLDTQPSFTSYYQLTHEAPGGIYELLLNRDTRPDAVISQTSLPNFHLIKSNDPHDQLKNHLLTAPDGRLRLRQLIAAFPEYDVIIIDTQGAYSVLPQIATFASDIICCPTVPAISDAREFFRGTMSMFTEMQSLYQMLGLPLPQVRVGVNRMDPRNSKLDHEALRVISDMVSSGFPGLAFPVAMLSFQITRLDVYNMGSKLGLPVHRLEPAPIADRKAPAASQIIYELSCALFPEAEASLTEYILSLEAQAALHSRGKGRGTVATGEGVQ